MYIPDALAGDPTPIHQKVLGPVYDGQRKVFADPEVRKFKDLPGSALLDTSDLCRIYGCSRRTIYRWIADRALHYVGQVGREYLFSKSGLIEWHARQFPPPATAHSKWKNL